MKKYLLASVFGLVACTNSVLPKSGAEKLVQLKQEPSGCELLYSMDADANFYSEQDAMQYFKNRIAEKTGNAFWVRKKEKRQNDWKIFAPEYSYAITANVYDCPSLK